MIPATVRSIRSLNRRWSIQHALRLYPRYEHTYTKPTRPPQEEAPVPLRKHLKDALKASKRAKRSAIDLKPSNHNDWELTVGIEVHAELNTARKLFSDALTTDHSDGLTPPNTHVAPFDAAIPGTQPVFQPATLVPAIRAALALGCEVQTTSRWDRKHYFYWDQPNGYQITQHYEPLARNGAVYVPGPDGPTRIGIKQMQLEQDTAKTTTQPGGRHLIDLNRVSHPLIEIITLPHITSPTMAGAVVRQIAALLKAVDACVGGMETGALRADVNVSVRRRGTTGRGQSYDGVSGLGVRTEIKNLSSFKAVEDAVAAERDRQITVLEAGGQIECETRAWSVGATQTTLLRGKEGVVDYRYMPDADLGAVYLDQQLIEYLRDTMPELPDATVQRVVKDFGMSEIDAKALCVQDDGERLEFLAETVGLVMLRMSGADQKHVGRTAGNWILHELGGLLTTHRASWTDRNITADQFAELLTAILEKQITARTAKALLRRAFEAELVGRSVDDVVAEEGLRVRAMSVDEYRGLAQVVLDEHPALVAAIRTSGEKRKAMFFVGQMMRRADEGSVDATKAKKMVEELLDLKT